MPQIETWSRLPPAIRDHLVERMRDRNLSLASNPSSTDAAPCGKLPPKRSLDGRVFSNLSKGEGAFDFPLDVGAWAALNLSLRAALEGAPSKLRLGGSVHVSLTGIQFRR